MEHKEKDGQFYGYGPYVSEMNMWTSHFNNVIVVGFFNFSKNIDQIELPYIHPNVNLIRIPKFNIKSISCILKLICNLPILLYRMTCVMRKADHLHFRCPSNVSAIASVVQVFFPKKPKRL